MKADLDRILSEFMDAWNAGRRPDVDAYLERVPAANRAELADEIASWLTWAPTPPLDHEDYEAIRAEPLVREVVAALDEPAGLWPSLLPRLRRRAQLSIAQIAERLTAQLGLQGREVKTADYLARMEEGRLDPTFVSRRVIDGLARILHVRADELEGAGALGAWASPAPAALFRAQAGAADAVHDHLELLAEGMAAPAEWDEVDELFLGGR